MSVYFYFHLGFINFFPHADAASAVKKKKKNSKKLQKTPKNSKAFSQNSLFYFPTSFTSISKLHNNIILIVDVPI